MALAALSGCEATFDPFEESDVTFSLFGYLDVSADTQYVRVGELQRSAFENRATDASVVLEDLDRGETFPMRDSVVAFTNGAFAHNYWTAAPIRPGTAYRLTATSPGGTSASATFETPEAIPFPELESGLSPYSSAQFPPTAQSLTLFDVEKLADVRVTYRLSEPTTTLTIQYLDRIQRTESGRLALSFNAYADVQRALGGEIGSSCPGLLGATVSIAATTDAWPDYLEFDAETLALPPTVTNVDGGLGYVGGVLTMSTSWPNLVAVFGYNKEGCE